VKEIEIFEITGETAHSKRARRPWKLWLAPNPRNNRGPPCLSAILKVHKHTVLHTIPLPTYILPFCICEIISIDKQ
jgi:hypothetical protein